ncbi:hypothetical protein CO157_03330 [Candidatus Peregrinibacteria bacterium CG_4_9_14_3_um_filter_49_12]|nr:MAG: hypothetical protein COV83_00035 [Candidatus Peregrinibacteria bacterium CG11_big_fil_rev_8_21_14_0_20_49_14]PJA67678.1 MAG: hypothetical protein CO157_03330 [Candidatus Peregrinibacteria bacterium CG_4_9_14_3_um_filter_49_12]
MKKVHATHRLFLTALLLTCTALPAVTHAARPTYGEQPRTTLRTLRNGAYNLEEVRRATYSPKEQEYNVFTNETLGFSAKFPAEWKTSYVTAKSLADTIVHFAPEKNRRSTLSVWVKDKKKQLTYEDVEKDFIRFTRQPINDYQIETMSFIREMDVLQEQRIEWKGKGVHRSVFTAGGKENPYMYIQLRIPDGTTLYVLSLAVTSEYMQEEENRLTTFLSSFRIFPSQTIRQILPSRSERRRARISPAQEPSLSTPQSRAAIRRQQRLRD